ncbi:hypothetical protein DJ021_18460, partial [Phenylobacterium hankyongense]
LDPVTVDLFGPRATTKASGGHLGVDVSLISGLSGGRCNGSIAECLGEDEFEMGSEATRRILQSNRYISNRAVKNGGQPAASPARSGQRYTPGCSNYNRCKR